MKYPRKILTVLPVLCHVLLVSTVSHAHTAVGKRGMVATVHPLATDAGLKAFDQGGNAIDAAVAAALTLGVVDGHNSGIGGGCFVLIRLASGELVAIDGREMAPAAATRDMFLRDGTTDPELSQFGPLAVGVPGALAAYERAMKHHGALPLSTLLDHAATIAQDGFSIDAVYARNLAENASSLAQFPATRQMLFKQDGSVYQACETLRLPDLARSYRQIAQQGTRWFYQGKFAHKVDTWMRSRNGLITREDFRRYAVKEREPVVSTYRGYQIVGFPPPSSGGIHVAQVLNILERFKMDQLLRDDPGTAHHVIAEAMKLAFADRAHWLGDADFVKVPRGLVSKDYARRLAQQIDPRHTTAVEHGVPPDADANVFGKHTTHIAAADAWGNWVAITATLNTSFGSTVTVPGTGILLNNQMDDFSAQPGAPNVFGLIGAEANAVAPGKRPLSSMSPTIVMKDGKPVLTLGAAGGPKIITQVILAIVNFVDGGHSLEESISRPRIHHQWRPDLLFVEQGASASLTRALVQRGHHLEVPEKSGVCQAIASLPDGTFVGVSDPRIPGKAAGFD